MIKKGTMEGFAVGIDRSLIRAETTAMRVADATGGPASAQPDRGTTINLNLGGANVCSEPDARTLGRYVNAVNY